MKRTILATCLAGACAVALSAQTPTQQPPTSTAGTSGTTSQETKEGNQRRGRPMTISGCLKAGDTAGTYMLTNVKGLGRPSGAAGTTGDTTGAPTTTGGATTTAPEGGQTRGMNQVMLTAMGNVDLKEHVGHQIEVTGTPARGQGAGSTAGGATTTGGTTTGGTTTSGTATGGTTTATTGQGNRGAVRSLTVTSIRHISDTCSQQ